MTPVLNAQKTKNRAQLLPSKCEKRFAKLMGLTAWNRLAPDVRRRFSENTKGGESKVYKGIITQTEMNFAGFVLAQACRVIGAPLPLERQAVGVPAVVSVTEDANGEGQFWTRTYGRTNGFPQVIHSSKRFAGTTGLEEYVGAGIGMALKVTEKKRGIVFTSAGYHLNVWGMRIALPNWLTPGVTTVCHDDLGDGYFAFTLTLQHAFLGQLIYQRAVFTDTGPRQRQ